jgi:hypothetical protein
MLQAMGLNLSMRSSQRGTRAVATTLLFAAVALLAPTTSPASVTTFGSQLSVPASKDTANDLNYTGSDVMLPGSIFHVPHDGADTALWNVQSPSGTPTAPASGQVTSVRLEGCAKQPAGAPRPLTQIHFQDLAPKGGGAVSVNVSTQAFDIPVCGENGASGSTVTTYAPTNFCVNQGDYVDFNDEGGFVANPSGPPPYPSGVPYMVIGALAGATMDSFIRNNGEGNGATFSPSDTSYHDGFASNANEELMLQATLATGADATPLCPGGTQGVRTGPTSTGPALPALRISAQTDGVNHSRFTSVAIYCRPAAGCQGVATLSAVGADARVHRGRAGAYGSTPFSIPGNKTSHVQIRVTPALIKVLRAHRAGVPVTLTVVFGGQTFKQTIELRI